MSNLAEVDTLVVSQKKEWGEIFTGFETRNSYTVLDASGTPLFAAAEEGGSILGRWFLKSLRPFQIHVRTMEGQPVLRAQRPFRFFFHEISVHDGAGQHLGTIKRRWTWLRRKYSVLDASGQEVFELFGPILHPWTFEIRQGEQTLGKITKKWSGLLKEAYTDADNFGITMPADWDVRTKALFLGAVFLIDFVHFED